MSNSFSRYKNIVFELARKNIRTQYKGSILGVFWTVLNPLLTMLVMWLVFSQFFGGDDPFYPLYLLAGNIVFTALRNSTSQSLNSIYNNSGLLLRTRVEPYIFPLSTTVSNIVNFFFSLIALIPFMIWLSIAQGVNLFTYRLLFIFLMLPAFWMFQFGIGLFLSVAYVFIKDVYHLYNVFLVLWNYITPIFYKPSGYSNGFVDFVIKANPMFYYVTYFRECVYMGEIGADTFSGIVAGASYLPEWWILGMMYAFGALSVLIGGITYKACEQNILMKL